MANISKIRDDSTTPATWYDIEDSVARAGVAMNTAKIADVVEVGNTESSNNVRILVSPTSQEIDLVTRAELEAAVASISGLSTEFKAALENIVNHLGYTGDDPTGRAYINALHNAMYPPANLTSISAVYTQSGSVYIDDSLDSLKTDLVVRALWTDHTITVVSSSDYVLSGRLSAGTSSITVSYGGKTTTFNVTVSDRYPVPSGYTKYDYVQNVTNSGTNTLINTGITFEYCAPTYRHKLKFRINEYGDTERPIMGARGAHFGGTWATENTLWINTDGVMRAGFSGANQQNLYTAQLGELIEYEQFHQMIKINGEVVRTATTSGTYTGVAAYMTIFGYCWGTSTPAYEGTTVKFKVYEYSITDENDNLVAYFTPCTNGNGQAGLFEHVSQTFKTAATPSYLACGNDA